VPGIHVFRPSTFKDVDGRDISAFTRVFDALCPAKTKPALASTKWRLSQRYAEIEELARAAQGIGVFCDE
jgi:hypothetical protein